MYFCREIDVLMLEFKDVTILNGDHPIVNGLSFLLQDGESLLLTGSSHCGKTRLLSTILGMNGVDSGFITIDGALLTINSAAYFRRMMGYVPQNLNLPYPTFKDMAEDLDGLLVNSQKPMDKGRLMAEWQSLGLSEELFEAPLSCLTPEKLQIMMLSLISQQGKRLLIIDNLASAGVASYALQMARSGLCLVASSEDADTIQGFSQHIRLDKIGI